MEPGAVQIVACAPIVKVKLPPVKQGMGLAIALPTKQAENLIKSGDPTLAETGRIFAQPENGDGNVYLNAFSALRPSAGSSG